MELEAFKIVWYRRFIRVFGLFQIRGLGRVWTYVTNRRRILLVETKNKIRYIISPEDPKSFLGEIQSFKGRC